MSIRNLFQQNNKLTYDLKIHNLDASESVTGAFFKTNTVSVNDADAIDINSPINFDKQIYSQSYTMSNIVDISTFSGTVQITNFPLTASDSNTDLLLKSDALIKSDSLVFLQLSPVSTQNTAGVELIVASLVAGAMDLSISVWNGAGSDYDPGILTFQYFIC